ncbi:FtsP/CotA-like multicopper oxidase with cupredoxin domain [Bradyrhizobium sp. USDA 4451]
MTTMIAMPYDYFLISWFALAFASTAYVAYDQFAGNPEPTVMKWGFILITLYMGPFGLLLYVLTDKEPRPGEHEAFTAPLWKQGVGSTIHCVAGDATGIILAAVITASLALPMWVDLIVEYLTGFSFGLFVFQSLFMKRMMGGSYWDNVKASFMPEFISMNAMMAGMAPTMSTLMMGRDMRAMDPLELVFWGVMSIGVMVGFSTAYPFNVWMVKNGIKHGLMTERPHAKQQQHAHQDHKQHRHGEQQSAGQEHRGMAGRGMKKQATIAQQAALAAVTSLLLISGMVLPGFSVNLGLSGHDVDDAIMPPGMIGTFDLSGDAMKDMAAVKPRQVGYVAPADARGDRVLEPRIENGVKVFDIDASVIRWNILPDVAVDAYAYNRQIPGPRLQLTEGDHVRINFHNNLPESTTVHWHGLIVPNAMDGPAEITQPPIPPGGSYTYEYEVGQHGTYFYHSHDRPDRQQALGLYGALIIAPKDPNSEVAADLDYVVQLQEWLKREWRTYPAMLMEGEMPNYFTINGKAYPATDTISMKVGQTIKIRFIGTNNNFVHPMHIHGGPFEVVAVDGVPLSDTARYQADTINVGPGQRYDVIWTARKPGKWLVHCHIPHHTENNNTEQNGGGGLMLVLNVE